MTEIAIAQASDHNLTVSIQNSSTNLNYVQINMSDSDSLIGVDISTGGAHVLVPEYMRKQMFDQVHNLSHPGGKASVDLIKDRFSWKNMKRGINRYARNYGVCQKVKVQRHNVTPLQQFKPPD